MAALAALAVPTTPTHAAARHGCTGTIHLFYTGGLNDTERPVGVTGDGTFVCPVEADPHRRGRISLSNDGLPALLSCSTGRTALAGRLTWSDNTETVFRADESEMRDVSGVRLLTLKGTVTGGDFTGYQVEAGFPLSREEDASTCATPEGLARHSGPFLIVISN
ncbi:hypothetical protein LX15_005653 [Streptoalloteichus tenebrarius]|uniref:Secreted protein n=2 Tax=Streptoalloteichus tenebrarius (strain ATCC 17920 / DSM 40477 / JCM 4838 / CBS 697.72 / NBRC 16177 / NCIMB 11028 / NRRL B-12390 / A12253. 1 / ISP 5477) TaxID=1933 RepID=A0ABT1I2I2_STRSD|nr:hypothetical protein [Streptoalloteichus tenebrarius]BFF02082.1 hypothetical protein GCM10020241_37570 [Streptoalloteichus tenebrarius]